MEMLKRGFIYGVAILLLQVTVAPAAQADIAHSGNSSLSGSVGTLVSAAMQTAGIYAQAKVLSTFGPGLKSFAALCYICSLIGAILSLAVFGNYSKALYFLIGPALFFFMIDLKEPIEGSSLRFGDRVIAGSVKDQKDLLKRYVTTSNLDGSAQVSRFFVIWDELVSSVVQGIVNQIVNTGAREDLRVKARERVLSSVIRYRPPHPGFIKLVNTVVLGQCGVINKKLVEVLRHRKDPNNMNFKGNLDETGEKLLKEYRELAAIPRLDLDKEVVEMIDSADFAMPRIISCQQAWNILQTTARAFANERLKIANYIKENDDENADPGGVPWDKVEQDIRSALEVHNRSADEILAGYMLKNAMRGNANSSLATTAIASVQSNRANSTGVMDEVDNVYIAGGFMRIVYFSKAIPYIQGLIIYILTISFPFFAVFLVMPGRASTFIVWMSLWVWVKSWDIGFALLAVARKVMWLFVRGGVSKYAPENVVAPAIKPQGDYSWSNPETILSVISDNDPTATLNTYFIVIGMLTVSVPMVMAYFCLGASNLFGAFSMSIDQVANKFNNQARKMYQRKLRASPVEQTIAAYEGLIRSAGTFGGIMGAASNLIKGFMDRRQGAINRSRAPRKNK